jgi:phosphoglycerol transferase MdoB-like AlkP superfamily enzyme
VRTEDIDLARIIAKAQEKDAALWQDTAQAWHEAWPIRLAISATLALVVSAVLVFSIELVARGSFVSALSFFADAHRPSLTTIGLFLLLTLGLDGLLGRRFQSMLIIAPLLLVLAWVGQQKVHYLGDPLYPTDFLYYRQIVELMPLLVRERPLTGLAMAAGGIVGIGLFVFAWRFWRARFAPLSMNGRVMRMVLAIPALAFFVSIMDYGAFSWTRDRLQIIPIMWDQRENYAFNGFTLAFALNVPMAHVPAPAGYTPEALDRIGASPREAAVLPDEKPDIVIVMSESFWDPTRLPGIKIWPDPIPTTRSLQSGHVFSPEFGGMTSNVEFEALTGFSNAFLPYGSIPYQQYVREQLPSLASFFREEGYLTTAIHPFTSWFWNRGAVYHAFGFDSFLSEENMLPLAKRGPLASDAALTEEIIRRADSSSRPSFIFAVSLQGHGPYEPHRYKDVSHSVVAPGKSTKTSESILTYAEGASDADKSLARLISWAKNRERPTVIALFGDHLPPLGPVYVETGFMKEQVAPRRGSADEMKRNRETPLVVWSNRTGKAKKIGTISPAFVPLQVLKAAGIRHPYYTDFLGDVHKRYRVIDRNLLLTREGKAVSDWVRAKKVDPWIRDYRLLQYDMIFGDKRSARRFFPETHKSLMASSFF